jgi:hypothetical protein
MLHLAGQAGSGSLSPNVRRRNMLVTIVVAALKLVLGVVAAVVLVLLAAVLNMPYGGGGSGLIGLAWVVIIASFLWALLPFYKAWVATRETLAARRVTTACWQCRCGMSNEKEQSLCVACSSPKPSAR